MQDSTPKSERLALGLSMSLFFLCGFSTVLNVVLIPYLQSVLQLHYTPIAFIQVSFYLAYFVFSPLTGYIFQKRPYLDGIRCGLFIGSSGSLTIYLASVISSYPLILLGVFILGAGIAMIQVTGNPYAMAIGSKETAPSRLTLAQAFTSVGTVIAPYIGSVCLLSSLSAPKVSYQIGDSYLHLLYLLLAFTWLGLLIFTYKTDLPTGEVAEFTRPSMDRDEIHPLKERFVLLGLLAIGLSSGIEVTISTYLVKFLSAPDIAGVSMVVAGKFMMIFWFGFLIGRLFGSKMLKKFIPENMLWWHAIGGIVLTMATVLFSGYIAAATVLSIGFFISIMFPVIFSLVLAGCRSDKSAVAGFLCMANIGGALLPLLQGMLADRYGLHRSFLLPICGFAYIACYSLYIRRRSLGAQGYDLF